MGGKRRVLIVEDEPNLADLMVDYCGELGVVGVVAMNGEQALAKALSEKPDIIVIDHRLPDMSGLDVIAKLKNNPATRGIPLLYASADALLHEAEARALGATGVLVKPVSAGQLEKALVEHLGSL